MSDKDQLQRLAHLRASYPHYAAECLQIRDKRGSFRKLLFNGAQQLVHARFEYQLAKRGYVRALILKGRQQGISTYIGGRFYHRATMNRGVNVFILSHEQTSTDTLFGIVDRYQRNNPLAPHVGVSNVRELEFDRLESSYAVATAGNKATGRSKALSLFHGSEVAFWTNAGDHFAASVQAVPLEPRTEVALETTSAGPGGEYYERFTDAMRGEGDDHYEAIFIPWYMSPEYSMAVDDDFRLKEEASEAGELSEAEYAELFGLTVEQMAWRRFKINEFRDLGRFKREYPSSVAEAWTSPSDKERFMSGAYVLRARKNPRRQGSGPLILGVDPASGGGDRFAVCARRGNVVEWVDFRVGINVLEAYTWVKNLIDDLRPARVYIDAGNIGVDVITLLHNAGPTYFAIVKAINFGSKSEFKMGWQQMPGPQNRRAEMYGRGRDWLEQPSGCSIPDMEAFEADLTAPRLKPQLNNDWLIESKKEMRSRGVRSTDLGDSFVLTFASLEYIPTWDEPAGGLTYGNVDSQVNRRAEELTLPVGSANIGPHGWMG